MPVIAVMYPTEGGSFDEAYYTAHHMPLVRTLWSSLGLTDTKLLSGRPGPDGAPPTYAMVALLTFTSIDAFQDAAAQHGVEIFGDIPNFTTTKPVLQFTEAV